MKVLTQPQIYHFLDSIEGWSYEEGKLVAQYEFEDFLEAVSFINDIAEVAEHIGHHPDMLLQYNKVTVSTCTYDAEDQITDLDIVLVERIEALIED